MDDDSDDKAFAWSDRVLRDEVLDALRHVIDPDLHRDIVSCGFIKSLRIEDGVVSFQLALTTPACPEKEYFVEECHRRLKQLDWVVEVDIIIGAQSQFETRTEDEGLADVREVLLVTSCKGGVGKSTVATNLAFILAQSGAKVGLLDLDIYGASLPTLLPQLTGGVLMEDQMLVPREIETTLKRRGTQVVRAMNTYVGNLRDAIISSKLKAMSPGWLRSDYTAMRGPLACELVYQLLKRTAWGELDYLIVDMPPGTGDIQLSVCELVPHARFVVVTTPHDLSLVDTQKGYELFVNMGLAFCGLVLNEIFNSAPAEWDETRCCWKPVDHSSATSEWLAELRTKAPLCALERSTDLGICQFKVEGKILGPLALAATADKVKVPNTTLIKLRQFTDDLVRAISRSRDQLLLIPSVKIGEIDGNLEIVTNTGQGEDVYIIKPAAALALCKCAECSDESNIASPDIRVKEIQWTNLTAVRIQFSNDHESTLAFKDLLRPASTATSKNCAELLAQEMEW